MIADGLGEIQLLEHLFVTLKELDGVPALAFLGQIMHGDLLDMGQGVIDRAGEAVLRHHLAAGHADAGLDRLIDAVALERGDFHDGAAELTAQLLGVDLIAVLPDEVHHVERDDHGDAELGQLGGQIEVALEVGGVDDVEDHIGALVDQIIPGDNLFKGVGREGVNARQVGDVDVLLTANLAFLLLNGDARPVADELLRARKSVKQCGLAAVRVTGKRNADSCHLTAPPPFLRPPCGSTAHSRAR